MVCKNALLSRKIENALKLEHSNEPITWMWIFRLLRYHNLMVTLAYTSISYRENHSGEDITGD